MNSLEQFLLKIFRTTVLRSHQKHSVPQQIWLFDITLFWNLSDKTFKRSNARGTFLRTETLQSDELESAICSLQTVDKFICLLQFSAYWRNIRLWIDMKTAWQDPCCHIRRCLVKWKSPTNVCLYHFSTPDFSYELCSLPKILQGTRQGTTMKTKTSAAG